MTEQTEEADGFEWMLIEIFGHRRHAGRVREEERFGAKMCRIDVPTIEMERPAGADEEAKLVPTIKGWVTHWYGGSSIFSATPTDEASVIKANVRSIPVSPMMLGRYDDDLGQFD